MKMLKALGIGLVCVASQLSLVGAEFVWNGKDLTGWKVPNPNPFWKVENGVLIGENDASNAGSMLYTESDYKDFVIEADARWSGEIDSGFMFRKPEGQMQIGISRSQKIDLTGSFYVGGKDPYPMSGRALNANKLVKSNDWNHFKLQARGDTYTVWINGEKASEYTNPKYNQPGPIGLQIHRGLPMKIEFRKIRIKSID